jgi:hypothetical protein
MGTASSFEMLVTTCQTTCSIQKDHNPKECILSRLVDELPRWLWAQGQVHKAVTIVEKAKKQNGCAEELDVAYFVSRGKTRTIDCKTENAGIADLIKTPNLHSRTLNVVFIWCVFCLNNLPVGILYKTADEITFVHYDTAIEHNRRGWASNDTMTGHDPLCVLVVQYCETELHFKILPAKSTGYI